MSKKSPLIFNQVRIRKMPGFPVGLSGYSKLSPGINVIAGPNASGKSSSARVIQQLLWHDKTSGLQAEGSATIEDDHWEFKIDSAYISVQRNGKDDILYTLPPVEAHKRYMLALHELVTENENELAKQIVRESIGGYDIDEAASLLEYSEAVKKQTVKEYGDYNRANREFKSIQQEHHDLKDRENKLAYLVKERDQARNSERLGQFYNHVIEFLKARLDQGKKAEALREFPAELEKFNGNEYDDILELEEIIEKTSEEITGSENSLARDRELLTSLDLPASGIDDKNLDELNSRIGKLEKLERDISESTTRKEEAAVRERNASIQLADTPDPVDFKGLRLPEVSELDQFLQQSNLVIKEKEHLQEQIKELQEANEDDTIPETEDLNDAVKALSYWLQETQSGSGIPAWLLPVIVAITILTGLLAVYAGWAWLTGILLATVAGWLASRKKTGSNIHIRQKDFAKTGLQEPDEWNIEKVTERLQELVDLYTRAKEIERNRNKITGYNQRLDALNKDLKKVDAFRDTWLEKLKAAPADYSGLYWFLLNARGWFEQHQEKEVLMERISLLQKEHTEELSKINTLFSPAKAPYVDDATKARTVLKDLDKKERKRRELVKEIERLTREISELKDRLLRDRKKMETIYTRVKVSPGHKEEIKEFTGRMNNYRIARKEYEDATVLLNDRKRTLEMHSLYSDHGEEIASMDIETAKNLQDDYDKEAAKLGELTEEINKIQALVENKKQEHNLENAIAERDDALYRLGQLYEENLASVTGNLIIDHLRKETSELNRPAVYKRAGELLSLITGGRYELVLEEKDEPAFRAFDTVNKNGLDLSELSTGTRIQLLLAVRLAFIEMQETGIKLPVLADELLANSDDIRSTAIIRALAEISREGRQIFYFTAQEDEVARWEEYMKNTNNVDFKIMHLSGQGEYYPGASSNKPRPVFNYHVVSPDGMDYETYGRKISVEPFDPLTTPPSRLHLWYYFNDPVLLYSALKKGISTIGQLESFLEHKGKIDGLTEELWTNVKNKARMLERYIELYRTGRPRPIDRHVLESSKAVNETFINEVTDVLDNLSGNPEKLLQALENKAVSGFRKSKIEELQEYLSNEGYLDSRPVIPEDEINLRMAAFISMNDLDTGEAESFLERVMQPPVPEKKP